MKELKDKIVKKIFLNDNKDLLKFETDQGDFIYEAAGDCCSKSYFSNINGIPYFLDTKILEVKEYEEVVLFDAHEEFISRDQVMLYRISLVSDGYCLDIEFRNNSNGYYGGSCYMLYPNKSDEYYYGEYRLTYLDKVDWYEVKEDL